ncbi:MAG: aminotransferase class III-fold pyridoxal phosphate-dependent enzyme [Anaerolineaceae bacterium]|nr:aminotransferase class III-fold pyridoxal phosphate-dependent enzyme [Anaerolineaceae bacterium]
MAGRQYSLKPKKVPPVKTRYRTIKTRLPVPESVPILKRLRKFEPQSMGGQPPVLWERAKGCQVWDRWGNKWLDWSSGVLVTNVGHGRKEIVDALVRQARKPMLHNYCFPSELRGELTEALVRVSPKGIDKCFLLTTGSEATECAMKLARTHGLKIGGKKKIGIVSYQGAFHGRTLGAQMMGGIPALQDWIVNLDRSMWHVPFPDGYWVEDTSFEAFLKNLKAQGATPDRIAGVITETYQGGNASFAPKEYMQKLAAWCKKHKIVLIMDEVQAGFGRTGKYWGFQHYGITPDLVCCGKGISSSLPLSCVLGRADIMDLYPPGSMTSTHTGSPLPVVAALASLELIKKEKMVANAARLGKVLHRELAGIQKKYPTRLGYVHGKGLVASLHMIKPGRKEPDVDLAFAVVERCVEKGLMLFSPVGVSCVKISPPLCITEAQLLEGCEVVNEAIAEVLDEGA